MQLQELVMRLLKKVSEMAVYEMIGALKELKDSGFRIGDCLEFMQLWFRDVLMFKATQDSSLLIFKDEYKYLKEVSDHSDYAGIEKILAAIDKARVRLDANVNFELTMELMLLVMKENIL